MRLDKYLKVARIIKRRTVANNACDAERVKVNGKDAKASYQVKIGDVIELTMGDKTVKVRVTDVKEYTKKDPLVAKLYEWVTYQFDNGRITMISDAEMEEQIATLCEAQDL